MEYANIVKMKPIFLGGMTILVLAGSTVALLFLERDPSGGRRCQHTPGVACQCAGERDGYVYPCECCAASPCRPEAQLDMGAVLKAQRAKAREAHENP